MVKKVIELNEFYNHKELRDYYRKVTDAELDVKEAFDFLYKFTLSDYKLMEGKFSPNIDNYYLLFLYKATQ